MAQKDQELAENPTPAAAVKIELTDYLRNANVDLTVPSQEASNLLGVVRFCTVALVISGAPSVTLYCAADRGFPAWLVALIIILQLTVSLVLGFQVKIR